VKKEKQETQVTQIKPEGTVIVQGTACLFTCLPKPAQAFFIGKGYYDPRKKEEVLVKE